jgi:NADH:ubiquinone oxidoreductase subunit 6 (subunit J)
MSEHVIIVIVGAVGILTSVVGLTIMGLQLREARRESTRLFTVVGGLVVQEVDKLRAAIEGRR